MIYNVLNDFIEKNHKNEVYRKGDTYPKQGFNADSNRIAFLQEVHLSYGVPFLEKPIEPKKLEPIEPKKPVTKRTVKIGDK